MAPEVDLKTKGRMRGQAFVTFLSSLEAAAALEGTHGLVVDDRPLIVVSLFVSPIPLEKEY